MWGFFFHFRIPTTEKKQIRKIKYNVLYGILLIEYTLNSENARKLCLFSFEQRH